MSRRSEPRARWARASALRSRRVFAAVTRRWGFASRYRTRLSWIGSYYDALVRATAGLAWPARGTTVGIALKALAQPLFVRLGSSDWFVVEEVFLRDVYAGVRELLGAEVENVVDLGANVGITLRLWHAYWPHAKLLAVEPDGDNLRVLRRNLQAAGCASSVCIVRACAVGTARTVHLQRGPAAAGYRIADVSHGEPVAGRTVAQLLDAAGFGRVSLLKCDIEGAERELFAACAAWIQRVRLLVVEVHDGYSAELLERDLRANGGRFERMVSADPSIVILRALGE
jgi:FkbM family methyltransferase